MSDDHNPNREDVHEGMDFMNPFTVDEEVFLVQQTNEVKFELFKLKVKILLLKLNRLDKLLSDTSRSRSHGEIDIDHVLQHVDKNINDLACVTQNIEKQKENDMYMPYLTPRRNSHHSERDEIVYE